MLCRGMMAELGKRSPSVCPQSPQSAEPRRAAQSPVYRREREDPRAFTGPEPADKRSERR
ncbi:hypothetical protein EYF80_041721 [Liparis tanakae]|uniref:Uncharacterized protein n=1 Tax=Liparis tanakae TaxID=230148 RepID=A0A4Z2G3E6_9TELE|nr:hypothetical protein EYF80_041721 [Liparis tanakae]